MPKISIVYRSHIKFAAPIITIAEWLSKNGFNVEWISPHDKSYSFNNKINIKFIPFFFANNFFLKLLNNIIWNVQVFLNVRKSKKVYVVGADTIIFCFLLRFYNKKIIYHLRELHDSNKLYIFLLNLIILKQNKIIVPEINRAYLYKFFFNLKSLPYVLPNMPVNSNAIFKENIDCDLPNKFILYQGAIHKERDLTKICHSILNLDDNISLVCLGRDFGMLSVYRSILKERLVHINHIAPPNHLLITKLALAGIAVYDKKSLNTIYCAPNKLWEYTSNGVPIISSDNPSMIYDIKVNGIGVIINDNDTVEGLSHKITNMLSRRKDYSINCVKFYKSNINEYNNKLNEIFN